MTTVHLITGGSRSGKSRHALERAAALGTRRVYLATCPRVAGDAELDARIARHVAERATAGWRTVEEEIELAAALGPAGNAVDADVVLVDCLTLWVSNLLLRADAAGDALDEDDIRAACGQLLDACARRDGDVLFVTNEVGLGVVPDNALARRFRDLAGRCNQTIAAGADRVTLMVSGLPMELKP